MDSKSLLGAYIATESPGQFVWRAGLLAQVGVTTHLLVLEGPVPYIATDAPGQFVWRAGLLAQWGYWAGTGLKLSS